MWVSPLGAVVAIVMASVLIASHPTFAFVIGAGSESNRACGKTGPDHIAEKAQLHRLRIGCDNFLNVLMGNF